MWIFPLLVLVVQPASPLLGLLSHVCPNVSFEVGVVAEAAPTLVAGVRLFAGVDPQVFPVPVKSRQSLPAHVARVRSVDLLGIFPVALHVFGPLSTLSKHPTTNGATVWVQNLAVWDLCPSRAALPQIQILTQFFLQVHLSLLGQDGQFQIGHRVIDFFCGFYSNARRGRGPALLPGQGGLLLRRLRLLLFDVLVQTGVLVLTWSWTRETITNGYNLVILVQMG